MPVLEVLYGISASVMGALFSFCFYFFLRNPTTIFSTLQLELSFLGIWSDITRTTMLQTSDIESSRAFFDHKYD